MHHNDYLFSARRGNFRFLRRFEDMYRNCDDPHGQSTMPDRLDYQLISAILKKVMLPLRVDSRPVSLLDIGCGLGYFTGHIKSLFPDVEITGCDISATAVEKARARVPQCEFFPADLKDKKSLPQRSYNILLALGVLCYFTEDEIGAVLQNLRELADPGGYVLVAYHLPDEMNFGRYIRSLDDAKVLFKPYGFSFRLTLDLVNELDKTYADEPVGRNIYFLAQRQ